MKEGKRAFSILCLSLFSVITSWGIDLNVKNISVEEAISTLNRISKISIIVNPDGLDIDRKVTVKVTDATIEQTLDKIFEGQSVIYDIQPERIIIRKGYVKKEDAPQEAMTIKGIVHDQDYVPVPGAVVLETSSGEAAVTDNDGNFTLCAKPGVALSVSCLGFKDCTVRVDSKEMDIVLTLDNQLLEEVVVVGYGTQKKVNLTGSISSVDIAEMTESRPITNLSFALAGVAAGVAVTSNANKPGSDNATILVRGQGTLNSSAPLVIIDGVEASYNSVNPQDVASISVLKDAASAAIYGSRAANGVILITTKEGKPDQFKLDYHGYVSMQSARKAMNLVSDYADYMTYANEAYSNSGLPDPFSTDSIKEWRSGSDPLIHPNTDWFDALFKTQFAHNHTLSMNGGTENLRAYISMGLLDNPGIMENSGQERYSIRANFDGIINRYISVGVKLDGYYEKFDIGTLALTGDDVFKYIYSISPGVVPRHPDGRFGGTNNIEDETQSSSILKSLYNKEGYYNRYRINTNMYAVLTPFKGFTLTGNFRYSINNSEQQFKPVFHDAWNFRNNTVTMSGTGRSSITKYGARTSRMQWELLARYENSFAADRLSLNVLAGMNQEEYASDSFTVRKFDLTDMSLSSLDAAIGEATASGHKTEWAMHSYFARINLGWMDRYLLEVNFRADGSSRFRPENRWGYFPSVSAAWRISQEEFMSGTPVTNLKLRISYGSLGNNAVGNYAALSTLTDSGYSWGDQKALAIYRTALANPDITWESTHVADIGVDFGFFKGRFNGTVDYFDKTTDGILISLPAPGVHGNTTIPTTNAAVVSNRGAELSLSWNDMIGDFSYGINGNITYISNRVEKFKGNDYSLTGSDYIKEGLPINSQYGLRVDRIVQTDEDIALVKEMIHKTPGAFKAFGEPRKGDFLYKDTNGDGKIDNNDREIISDGPLPKFTFGLNATIGWKGIDFSILFQGQAGASRIICSQAGGMVPLYRHGYALNADVVKGRWYEGRTDATWPRLLEYQDTRNTRASDFYLEDLSFLKIRNIQLGYTLPSKWMDRIHIGKVRLYCSLENFFTFTRYRLIDPETSMADYPTIRQAVLGLNVTF